MSRVLPAAQYDALKAAAEKNGGVGSAEEIGLVRGE